MKTIKALRGFRDLDKNVPRKKGDQWEVTKERADFLVNKKKWAAEVQVKEEKQVRKTKEDKTELKTK